MTGTQENPDADLDGTAIGQLTINEAGDANPTRISWNFTYSNIAAPTDMHIHVGGPEVNGGVLVGLGVATTGGSGTLINFTDTSAANRDAILANPFGHYVNIHNADFPGGAVRGQLVAVPEPSVLALLGIFGIASLNWRRRFA